MSQPEINIGTAGHVDHGKTSLLERLTGKWADTHSSEKKKGITIKLGFADAQIYYCSKCKKYQLKEKCDCGGKSTLKRKISFVDAPGHESLMATMLSGAATMDGTFLLIAANEGIQEQTREHLRALQILEIPNIIVVQNKIDLVDEETAIKRFKEIKKLLQDTPYKDAKIIPISAQHEVNFDELLKAVEEEFKTPKRDEKKNPILIISRSFDINKPGQKLNKLQGGVLGGVILQGVLKPGDEVEIKPGYRTKDGEYHVMSTVVESINSGREELKTAKPGGSVGVKTLLDPYLTKSDNLSGQVLALKNKTPPVLTQIKGNFKIITKDEELNVGDPVMISAWTAKSLGIIKTKNKEELSLDLKIPICIEKEAKIAISKMKNQRWVLVGFLQIK